MLVRLVSSREHPERRILYFQLREMYSYNYDTDDDYDNDYDNVFLTNVGDDDGMMMMMLLPQWLVHD